MPRSSPEPLVLPFSKSLAIEPPGRFRNGKKERLGVSDPSVASMPAILFLLLALIYNVMVAIMPMLNRISATPQMVTPIISSLCCVQEVESSAEPL